MFIKNHHLYYEVDLQYSYDLESDTTVLDDNPIYVEVDREYLWGDDVKRITSADLSGYLSGFNSFIRYLADRGFETDDAGDVLFHLYVNELGNCVLDNIVLEKDAIHEGYLYNYSKIVMEGENSIILSDLNIPSKVIDWVFTVCRRNNIGDIYFLLKLKGEKVKTVPRGISFTKFGLFSHSKEEVSYSLKLGENSLVLIDNAIKSKSSNAMNKVVELQDFLIGEYDNYI